MFAFFLCLKCMLDFLQIHSFFILMLMLCCIQSTCYTCMYISVHVRINKFHVAYTPFYPVEVPITEDTCLTNYLSVEHVTLEYKFQYTGQALQIKVFYLSP